MLRPRPSGSFESSVADSRRRHLLRQAPVKSEAFWTELPADWRTGHTKQMSPGLAITAAGRRDQTCGMN